MEISRLCGLVLVSGVIAPIAVIADTVQYTASPGSYPSVASGLRQEFGTASFPPLSETVLSSHQVQGSSPVTLTLRFHADTAAFLFDRILLTDAQEGVATRPSQPDRFPLSVKGLTTQGAQNIKNNINQRLIQP